VNGIEILSRTSWFAFAAVVALTLSTAPKAQGEPTPEAKPIVPMFGDTMPDLDLEYVRQVPDGQTINLGALKGKFAIIEFWGKSCGACIEVLPHLREIAEDLEGEDLQFVFIADEAPDDLAELLEKHAMPGWHGFDPDRSVFDSWGVNSVPSTFVLDREGRLVIVTYPLLLTVDAILDLLAGKELPKSVRDFSPLRRPITVASFSEGDLVQLVIRVADSDQMLDAQKWEEYVALGMQATRVLQYAFDVSSVRMEVPVTAGSVKLDVTARVPRESGELLKPMLQNALLATLGLRSRWEERVVEVLVFGVSESPCFAPSKKGDPLPERRERHLVSRNTCPQIVYNFEEFLGLPVILEDTPDAIWMFDIPLSGQGLSISDLESCGVAVKREKRAIEIFVLEHAEKDGE